MNLSSLPLPAGKTLSKPQSNLLGFMSSLGISAPPVPTSRRNPFSGIVREIPPLACALYDFITGTLNRMGSLTYSGQKVTVPQWDRARYLYLALYPESYYDLID